jgi:hypothetical protein
LTLIKLHALFWSLYNDLVVVCFRSFLMVLEMDVVYMYAEWFVLFDFASMFIVLYCKSNSEFLTNLSYKLYRMHPVVYTTLDYLHCDRLKLHEI